MLYIYFIIVLFKVYISHVFYMRAFWNKYSEPLKFIWFLW